MNDDQDAYEKLGAFYLGRVRDPATGQTTQEHLLFDSRDLTTHGLIVGMTGSGKTGLAIAMLEEAAMDRIPVIAIDPKGDLANLLLTFPKLAPEDFRPWINAEVARQQGQEPEAFAAAQAERWRTGLEAWGQDGQRIERLRGQADFTVYTPGSTAGRQVSVLQSFDVPSEAVLSNTDALRDHIGSTVTSLTTLQERERRALQAVEKRTAAAHQRTLDAAVSAGGGLLAAFFGRKSTATRAGSVIRSAGRVMQQRQEISQASETVEAVRQQMMQLEDEFQTELRHAEAAASEQDPLVEVPIRPTLTAMSVRLVTLLWLPEDASGQPLWRQLAATRVP